MFSADQLQILRHMLGIDVDDVRHPVEHRDYYCATIGDDALRHLQQLGAVRLIRRCDRYEWYSTTDAGKAAARASQAAMLRPKGARVYARYLDASDAIPDLTFRDFLTDPLFAATRQAA